MTDMPTVSTTSEPNGVQHKFVLSNNERSNPKTHFPIRFAIAFFALAIATHALASGFWHWLENAFHSPLLAHLIMSLFALVACIVAATLLWNMRLETHHQRKTHLVFIMLIATLGAIGVVGICHGVEELVGHAFSEHAKANSEPETTHQVSLAELLVWIAGTLGCSYWLAWEERRLPTRSLTQTLALSNAAVPNALVGQQSHPIEHLILPLTVPTNALVPVIKDGKIEFPVGAGKTIALEGTSEQLSADIIKLNEARHNWQQILRAIMPHTSTLRSVWIFGSSGSFGQSQKPEGEVARGQAEQGGSAVFVQDAICFLKAYLPDVEFHQVSIHLISGRELKFNNYNDLETTIEWILESIQHRFHGVSDRNITIDVTGGTKLTSVVAAAVTYRRQTCFQYVDTIPDADGNYPVHQYDIVFESRPEL
jgi:hypothetical protein